MRSVLKSSFIWGLIGLAVAVFFWVAWDSIGIPALIDIPVPLGLILWPGSLGFMADGESPGPLLHALDVSVVIFTNFVWYFVVGFVLTLVWKGLKWLLGHRSPVVAGR
jgi:hypothetical protein